MVFEQALTINIQNGSVHVAECEELRIRFLLKLGETLT